jgi:hypothetical protein
MKTSIRVRREVVSYFRKSFIIRAGLFGLALLVAGCVAQPVPQPRQATAASEEFVGPFASWKNLKRDYGAVGDGKADDTAAIQRAFDELQKHEKACVLFIPAGTYRITDMVKTVRTTHHECMGISIVGEDPATTTLRWDGKEGGIMVTFNAWYSKISRLTLDGAGRAGVALSYGGGFSTYNETSDMIFTDVDTGMSMGNESGNGQAENAVLRCKFIRCKGAGIRTNNYNSLDIWCWYCRFEDCGYGLFNGAGNFHAYECLFLRSQKMDIGTANLMVFSFINNTSIGSRCFLDWAGGHTWGSSCTIAGNRILEPTGDFAIRLGNGGPYLVMDNIVKNRAGNSKPAILPTWGDQVFVGNTYTVTNDLTGKTNSRFRAISERVVDAAGIATNLPVLPPTPPNRNRRVFEVAVGANSAALQAIVNEAAALTNKRPVVHLPMGKYKFAETIVLPGGCDVQIIGDGGAETATVIEWTGASNQPMFRLASPARATFRDLNLNVPRGTGILVEKCDQAGGRIFADQVQLSGGWGGQRGGIGLLADGVEQSDVMLRNFQGATMLECWLKVLGGKRSGPGQITVCCGATGTSDFTYTVERGGRLVVRSVYHEVSGDAAQAVLLNDTGTLAVDATRYSYKTSAEHPLFRLDNFRGAFTVGTGLLLPVGSPHTARLQITGDGSGTDALCLGNVFWVNEPGVTADKVFLNQAVPSARAAMLACNMNSGTKGVDGFSVLDNRGKSDDAFVLKMLAPLREARVWRPVGNIPGVTATEFHRVNIGGGKASIGIALRAD